MTQVDFYQIDSGEDTFSFCCRLVSKAWRQGNHVYIHTSDRNQAEKLDTCLWSFRAESFVPHSILENESDDNSEQVGIGYKDNPGRHQDVLVNLSEEIPDFFSRFKRVAEIVPFEKGARESARKNFQFYKDRGYPIKYHNLTGNPSGK